ncbi:MAG: polyprenyl synthetase family protein [Pyrinomonadaceae bacterium]|nr:polyprenyl synthetase family protein [Pyrinomonadaceae bacterium]
MYVAEARPDIERALLHHIPTAPARVDQRFNEALRYALFPGGKRLRPVMTMLGAEAVGGCRQSVLSAAASVEFVHTSSLIFDDLPCMDDASERRGRAALHLRYGQGLAVLVALALMNTSYGLVFDGGSDQKGNEGHAIRAHRELVECIGERGMVAGQAVDLSVGSDDKSNFFGTVRNLKTSALMRLSVCLGAILSGANKRQLVALSRYAAFVGDAYQISDDVLDVEEDAASSASGATVAIVYGIADAKKQAAALITQAKNALTTEFGFESQPVNLLCEMADYIVERAA